MVTDPLSGSMFDLDSYSASSGLYAAGDGLDVVIPKGGMWVQPYKLKGEKDVPMQCAVAVHYISEDSDAGERIDYLTIGNLAIWAPSNDGHIPIPLPDDLGQIVTAVTPEAGKQFSGSHICAVKGDGAKLSTKCLWYFWYQNAQLAGLPPPTSLSINDLVRSGIRCHINLRAKEGAKKKSDGTPWENIVITRFDGFVGESAGAGAGAASAPNAGQSTTAATGGDFGDMNTIALELVATAGGTLAKKDLLPQLLGRFAGQPENVKRAVAFSNSLSALGAIPGVAFDPAAQTLTLG